MVFNFSPAFWLLDRIWRPALIGKKLENDKLVCLIRNIHIFIFPVVGAGLLCGSRMFLE